MVQMPPASRAMANVPFPVAFPDPYVALQPRGGGRPGLPAGWTRQQRRRSEILAAARRLLAQEGYEDFSVRSLADRCDISAQTIYRLAGDRAQTIADCVVEHAEVTVSWARSSATTNPIMALTEIYCQLGAQHPDFIANSIKILFGPDPALRQKIYKASWIARYHLLLEMKRQGGIKAEVDCRFLAKQIALASCASSFEWAAGLCDLEEHIHMMRQSTGSALENAINPGWIEPTR